MKKVILLSLLLAPFAACKKDSITDVAQPENIESITIVTTPVQNGEAADRGTCNLYCATRYRSTTDINSTAQPSAFTYQLWRRDGSGNETSVSPVLTQSGLPGSTGKNITWVVADGGGYKYFIKYGGFFPTGIYAHTYWADNIAVQTNPVANADVSEQHYTTSSFNTIAADVTASCVVQP